MCKHVNYRRLLCQSRRVCSGFSSNRLHGGIPPECICVHASVCVCVHSAPPAAHIFMDIIRSKTLTRAKSSYLTVAAVLLIQEKAVKIISL